MRNQALLWLRRQGGRATTPKSMGEAGPLAFSKVEGEQERKPDAGLRSRRRKGSCHHFHRSIFGMVEFLRRLAWKRNQDFAERCFEEVDEAKLAAFDKVAELVEWT